MSYQNFIPTIWNETINHELERKHVFVEDTNRQYEGDVQKAGDTVRILGVGKPTIKTALTKDGSITLNPPEVVGDSSVSLLIDHVAYFNYKVDDIDKRQAVGGVMDALSQETSEALAQEEDCAVSGLSTAIEAVKDDPTGTEITTNNILSYIDGGLEKLYENDVTPDTKITMTVPPWFYMILKQAYIKLDTDNSDMLENGRVGKYGNVIVRMSNNVVKDASNYSLIQLKTQRAIAYAKPMTHTEPYRPENGFSDAVKGFILFGTRIVRPKEMIILNCKQGA